MWWIVAVTVCAGVPAGYGLRLLPVDRSDEVRIRIGWWEGACAVAFGAAAWRVGGSAVLVPVLVLVWWMLACAVVDLRVRRLPNALTLPGAAAVVLSGSLAGQWRPAVAGALLLAGLYLLLHLAVPGAMGAGDVKLALGLGALTGLAGTSVWLAAAALAPVFTATAGLCRRRVGGPIAHGPSMCAATAVALWCL